MTDNRSEEMLQQHGIRPTANRVILLRALLAEPYPLSMHELAQRVQTIDKSVVSRTLALFRAQHLVHAFEDGSDQVKYEVCLSHDAYTDSDMHAHFYCKICHRTYCLWDVGLPDITVPPGFEAESVNFVIKGVCEKCARHRKKT